MTIQDAARRARAAQVAAEQAGAAVRSRALHSMAEAVWARRETILSANAADVAAAEAAGLAAPLVARLRLDERKFAHMVNGVRAIADLPDVIGEVLSSWQRPNELSMSQVRVPLGVIGIIYEARPGVTADAAALCLKAGNAVLLKGGKEAARSNAAIGLAMQEGLQQAGLPGDLAQVLPPDREAARALMEAVGLVDVLIPRGGAGLIQAVLQQSRVPVIETGTGVCHVYVHAQADLERAAAITVNAKCSNPSVCNAAETLLVDEAVAGTFLPRVGEQLRSAGVMLRGCERTRSVIPWAEAATAEDWGAEYLDLVLAVRVVPGLDEALSHIQQYGTRHSEAIITEDADAAARFFDQVDAAVVYHNASTRFSDGGEFGFGGEIGISTQKLHARGPMGLAALTSYKYLIRGSGQVRV